MAEDGQVPDVLACSLARIGQGPADVPHHRAQQRPGGLAGHAARQSHASIAVTCWRLSARHAPRRATSVIFAPLRVRCQMPNSTCTTTSGGSPRKLTWPPSATSRVGQLPSGQVTLRVGLVIGPPPLIVGVAQAAGAVGGAGARRHSARLRAAGAAGPGDRPGTVHMVGARTRWRNCRACGSHKIALRHRGNGQASRHRARGSARRQRRQTGHLGDLAGAQPLPGQPGAAAKTHARDRLGGRGAPVDPAHRPAQQPVPGGQRQHPAGRVPACLGQERRIEHPAPAGRPAHRAWPRPGRGRARARPAHRSGIAARHATGHGVTPACSRGLGTASTAARSRAGSGCR